MRSKLLIGLGVAAVLVAALFGFALYNANRLLARFKPDLEHLASEAAGSPVQLGNLDVSILPAARVHLDRLTVGGEHGLVLSNVTLQLRLLPLLARRLHIVTLELDGPRLTLVKSTRGITLEGLPEREVTAGKSGGEAAPPARAPVLALDLQRFAVRNGTFAFVDVERKATYTLTEASVDAALTVDASGVRVPTLQVAGMLAGAGPVTIDGKDIALDAESGVAEVPALTLALAGSMVAVQGRFDTGRGSGEFHVGSDGIDLARLVPLLEQAAPAVKTLALRGTVRPDIDVHLEPGGAYAGAGKIGLADVGLDSPAGPVRNLRGQITLRATAERTTVSSRDLALDLAGKPVGVTVTADLVGDTVDLTELVATAFSGTTRVSGTIGLATGRFGTDVTAEGLDLGQLQTALTPGTPPRMLATVTRFQAKLAGIAGDDLVRSVTGTGSLLLADGRIPGVNVAGEVLRKVTSLPFVSGSLTGALPDDVRASIEGPDTRIDRLRTDFSVGGAALRLAGTNIVNPAFTFDGAGRVGFDTSLDLTGTVRLCPSLSRGITSKAKELRALLDDQERLGVPVTITGTPPRVAVVADVTRLVSLGASKALEEKAGALLRGALGGKKGLGRLLPRF